MDMRVIPLALGAFAIGTDSFVVAGILPEIAQSLNVSIATAIVLAEFRRNTTHLK